MGKLIIKVEENTEIAKEILKGWQFIVYKTTIKSLKAILFAPVNRYKVSKEGNITIFEEEGNREYITMEKRRWENFMFSEEKELGKGKYKKAVNDRWMQKLARGAHKHKQKIKSKAIRAALGGTDVIGFFAKIGLFITWEVKKDAI